MDLSKPPAPPPICGVTLGWPGPSLGLHLPAPKMRASGGRTPRRPGIVTLAQSHRPEALPWKPPGEKTTWIASEALAWGGLRQTSWPGAELRARGRERLANI